MNKFIGYAGYIAFGMALIATLSSLYLSEVLHWTPCILCWYQRILMYPLVVVTGVGVIRRSSDWSIMALILGGIGWVVALYHSLLQWGVISESLAPCAEGVSCVTRHFTWLGFITIPFLSFTAFTVIIVMSLLVWKGAKSE
jgi:disulfide bond formation protein DsbB